MYRIKQVFTNQHEIRQNGKQAVFLREAIRV